MVLLWIKHRIHLRCHHGICLQGSVGTNGDKHYYFLFKILFDGIISYMRNLFCVWESVIVILHNGPIKYHHEEHREFSIQQSFNKSPYHWLLTLGNDLIYISFSTKSSSSSALTLENWGHQFPPFYRIKMVLNPLHWAHHE